MEAVGHVIVPLNVTASPPTRLQDGELESNHSARLRSSRSSSKRFMAHPLRPPPATVAECTESLTNPSTSRLLLAAIGLPVEYFVSNVEPELQAELAADETKHWHSTADAADDEDPLKTPWVAAVQAMASLRDARSTPDNSTTLARRVYAEKEVVHTLLELQSCAVHQGRLMASYRGEAGETIAHMACLLQLYDVLMAVLDSAWLGERGLM